MVATKLSFRCAHIFIRNISTEVRVRFAPSPTGKLHLGGLRTALFNFLLARNLKGKFIVRIEDTDQQRIVPGCAQKFEQLLDHFGLYRDEGPSNDGSFGPYLQSLRLQKYVDAVEELIDRGHAYRCFCSSERLELLRKNALRKNEIPRYDNHCRHLSVSEVRSRLADHQPHVVRFKLNREDVTFQDKVFGEVTQHVDEGDFVILKSDSFPTYHLANVVDDHLMEITHVVRGMEWIASTPKHIKLYSAFEWNPPSFVHLPLITRDGSKKLSKRDKDAFVDYYVETKGYLPRAVLNFLLRNGSGIRNFDANHCYSLEEMTEDFDATLIGRRNFMMDTESLDKYGKMAFRECSFERTVFPLIQEHFKRVVPEAGKCAAIENRLYVQGVIDFMHKRGENFSHLSQLVDGDFKYFFTTPTSSQKVLENIDATLALQLLDRFSELSECTLDGIKAIAEEAGVSYPRFMLLLRLTLIDNKHGPPIMDLVSFFGREKCLERVCSMSDMLRRSLAQTELQ